jgi:hypothetical protein
METPMWIRHLLDFAGRGRARSGRSPRPGTCRLSVEALDDRIVPAALLAVEDTMVYEGNTGVRNAAVTVSLSEPQRKSVSVKYRTADLSAAAGSDYRAVSGTVTFARGETSKTILVPVIGNRVAGPDGTTDFAVQIFQPKGAKIAQGQATVLIYDDEPWAFVDGVSDSEGNSGTRPFTFTVSLSGAYDLPVTVNYTTADGSAKAGTDYAATSGTLVFEPGETRLTLSVPVIGNRLPAQDQYKTFFVNLGTPDSHTAISYQGVGHGTIIDDEPRLGTADAYNFGGPTFTFLVGLSAAYDEAVTVNYTTADGTALAGVDYAGASGSITFAPGETVKTITIEALDPAIVPGKFFYLQLSGASASALVANEFALGYFDGYYDPGPDPGYDPYGYGYWY